MTGCAPKPAPVPLIPAPPSAETVQELRANYLKHDPTARIGLVVAVRDVDKLVAVGDVQVGDFPVGQAVTIVDQASVPLSSGRVVNLTDDLVIVKLDAPVAGARMPVQGDLAVRVQ